MTDWMSIIMLITELTLSGVIGLIVFLFKEINELKVQLASKHFTKLEMNEMLRDSEKRNNVQINRIIELLNEIRRENRR